jgi:hypothetical protein
MLKYGYLIVAVASAILAAAPAHAGLRANNIIILNALSYNALAYNALAYNILILNTPAINSAGEIGRVVAVELPRR